MATEETVCTPTQVLMNCLEEFGESEAKEVIVVYTNTQGDLCWHCSSDSIVKKLGLLEACKQFMVSKFKATE